jgi:hypothetical protein
MKSKIYIININDKYHTDNIDEIFYDLEDVLDYINDNIDITLYLPISIYNLKNYLHNNNPIDFINYIYVLDQKEILNELIKKYYPSKSKCNNQTKTKYRNLIKL